MLTLFHVVSGLTVFHSPSSATEVTKMSRPNLFILICALASAANAQDLPPVISDADFRPIDLQEAALGQSLFYDPILSGNRNVACASCHHPKFATADGVSLSFGDGGIGLGPQRQADPDNPPHARIPRNAPALFNLGAWEFNVLFHDGRLEAAPDHPGGLRSPMDGDMLMGFASPLAAQAMFPVLSPDEMAGAYDTNEIGRAVRMGKITGNDGAWQLLSNRVAAIPEYVDGFRASYAHINKAEDIAFTDIANAIAAFIEAEWRSDASPFDAFLRGQGFLNAEAEKGMQLFYGDAGCSSCHSGSFMTDHRFHAMAVPQIGPGKAAAFEDHHRDEGRYRVTGRPEDLYAFRTPSLRNVALTAPYGHAGSHRDLAAFVASHADPVAGLATYDPSQAILPEFNTDDFSVMNDPKQVSALASAVSTPYPFERPRYYGAHSLSGKPDGS